MSDELRSWLFRSLMFEADAQAFQDAGVRVGADAAESEEQLLNATLDPYPLATRNTARRMGRLYVLLNCFENSVRDLIRSRLQEIDADWWNTLVPKAVRDRAVDRQAKALKNGWLEGTKDDPMEFAEFGDLAKIMVGTWQHFEDLVPSQHWLNQRFEELEQARNWVAHNRALTEAEFARVQMYATDWSRQVGV